jgi:hypothetical protein
MTHWKITAVQGSETRTRTVYTVYEAAMVPAKMEQEGWHCTVTEHNSGTGYKAREVYQTENEPLQAALDLCMAKLDAKAQTPTLPN